MSIKILPPELINQIAAGEVVERPASVVKELAENSLDAKAQNITIELENGGINLIKIIDDGCGMSKQDARLSIAQHATSKIDSLDDLFNIKSLGFRGEALASISSVSEFSLITKNREDLSGVQIQVVNNQKQESEIGCAAGTSVEARNLFYNVPARKKYLKTAVTEYNHIVDLFINYALAYKKINWKLIHNKKTVYQFFATDDLKNRIMEVLGEEVAQNLLEVNYNGLEMKVIGFVGKPQIARNNRKLQFLFVNNRAVNEYIISKKVKDAFGQLIFHNLYPVYVLFLQIDPQKVDVNVHPRKMEVRFSEPQKIYSTIYRGVGDCLDDNELTRQVQEFEVSVRINENPKHQIQKPNKIPNFKFQAPGKASLGQVNSQMGFKSGFNVRPRQTLDFNQRMIEKHEQDFERQQTPDDSLGFKIIGQVDNSYIVVETSDSLKIYDQHAVSERVQYQKIKTEFLQNKIAKQQLLIPENIELTPGEANLVKEKMSIFEKFGFELNELSSNCFMVNAIPQILVEKDYKQALKDLIGEIVAAGDLPDENQINPAVDKILKMMSCKSAIKFGDELNHDEIAALLTAVEKCDEKFTCVHGRPNVIEYKFNELEKMFKRKG